MRRLSASSHGNKPMTLGLQEAFRDSSRILFLGALEDAWIADDSLRVRLVSDQYFLRDVSFEFACPTSERAQITGRTIEDPQFVAFTGRHYAVVGVVLAVGPLGSAPNGLAISGTTGSTYPVTLPRRLVHGTCTSVRALPGG
jgi:hypothetical protein